MSKVIITVVGKDTVALLQRYVPTWQKSKSMFWIFLRQLYRNILT